MEKSKTWNKEDFSPSTNELLKRMPGDGATLLQLMQILVKIHEEYGDSKRETLFQDMIAFLEQQTALRLTKYTPDEWVQKVIQLVTAPSNFPDINGRMFLIFAILLEFEVINDQLNNDSEWFAKSERFIQRLEEELLSLKKIDFRSCLTDYGQELRENLKNFIAPLSEDHGSLVSTPNVSDAPATEDHLSRKPLAEYIANRLRSIYKKEVQGKSAFFMHIDGAWGSGKSTLLHFLENELKNPDGKSEPSWMVINFNAWEHQRLSPPWWFLMQAAYKEIDPKLKNKSRYDWPSLKEWLWLNWQWHIKTGEVLAIVITFVCLVIALISGTLSKNQFEALFIVQVITFLGFSWSVAKNISANMPLATGSSKAAQAFIEANGTDPMQKLSKLFKRIIEDSQQPVAIFIDDLDRCNQEYGVKLLEGLQTIFKNAPVVYVIAADKRWLNKMYEQQYKDFSQSITTPTKPFGLVFLDKVFNFSLELPGISAEQKKRYWAQLIGQSTTSKTTERISSVKENIAQSNTMSDKMKLVDNATDIAEQQLYREEIVRTISIETQDREIEHKLMPFVDVIEPNPRAMKRLINDIGTAKALSILYNQRVEQEQLVLWSILKQQHPTLCDYFWQNPEKISPPQTGIEAFDNLLKSNEMKNFFEYTLAGNSIKLDTDFVQKMRFLQ